MYISKKSTEKLEIERYSLGKHDKYPHDRLTHNIARKGQRIRFLGHPNVDMFDQYIGTICTIKYVIPDSSWIQIDCEHFTLSSSSQWHVEFFSKPLTNLCTSIKQLIEILHYA